ncbi:hypothetical protein HY636_05745 [Candidatus Woesearchaeota archaeon]|nr:hypothetical protein [Candidatus Woesearchaeota archaeon]
MPIIRRCALPQNYEERLARIYCSVLNSATNSVVMLYLNGNEQSLPELREALEQVNPFFLKKKPSDFKAIISGSLCRAGVDSKIDGESIMYTLNEEGRYLVRPLAAHTLMWFYHNSDSCPEIVFGKDCGPSNAPYQRARLMMCINDLFRELCEGLSRESSERLTKKLSEESSEDSSKESLGKSSIKLSEQPSEDHPISLELDQICKKIGMQKPYAQHILYKIADTGLISYEHQEANKEFVFYRWKGGEIVYPQIKWIGVRWIGEGVVKSIVDYLYERRGVDKLKSHDSKSSESSEGLESSERLENPEFSSESSGSWVSPRQIWKDLKLGQRNFAYTVVTALYNQGYLEQQKGEMRKVQVKASPQLNNLCGLLSDINIVVRESIESLREEERKEQSKLLKMMQSEAIKLTDGSRESKTIIDEMVRRHVEALER